jgi:hypothetical protein
MLTVLDDFVVSQLGERRHADLGETCGPTDVLVERAVRESNAVRVSRGPPLHVSDQAR